MKTYKAVIFDLFDTLVDFDRALIPTVTIDGREVRTTAGETYKVLAAQTQHLTFDTYYRALSEVSRELTAVRERDHLEIPARRRFERLFDHLACHATPTASGASTRCWPRTIATCTTPRYARPTHASPGCPEAPLPAGVAVEFR